MPPGAAFCGQKTMRLIADKAYDKSDRLREELLEKGRCCCWRHIAVAASESHSMTDAGCGVTANAGRSSGSSVA